MTHTSKDKMHLYTLNDLAHMFTIKMCDMVDNMNDTFSYGTVFASHGKDVCNLDILKLVIYFKIIGGSYNQGCAYFHVLNIPRHTHVNNNCQNFKQIIVAALDDSGKYRFGLRHISCGVIPEIKLSISCPASSWQ